MRGVLSFQFIFVSVLKVLTLTVQFSGMARRGTVGIIVFDKNLIDTRNVGRILVVGDNMNIEEKADSIVKEYLLGIRTTHTHT